MELLAQNTQSGTNNRTTAIETVVPNAFFKDEPLSRVLNQVFYAGLVVAVVLALVMVVRGGIQYMTSESEGGKESGRNVVTAAAGGLVLAFSSVLILNSINPTLTSLSLTVSRIKEIEGIQLGSSTVSSISNSIEAGDKIVKNQDGSTTITKADGTVITQNTDGSMTIRKPDGTTQNIAVGESSRKIFEAAQNSIGNLSTCSITGTEGGKLGCAWAVNEMVSKATGIPVGGGLSTVKMYESLQSSDRFQLIGSDYSLAMPGDIIISPTRGSNTGHVGIVQTPGAANIISNSSRYGEVRSNHTSASWNDNYSDNGVYIYRAK